MNNLKGYRLEYKQGTKWNDVGLSWYLECKECSEMTKVGSQHVDSVLCSKCVSSQVNNITNDNDTTGDSL
jgi:hypothetical protein